MAQRSPVNRGKLRAGTATATIGSLRAARSSEVSSTTLSVFKAVDTVIVVDGDPTHDPDSLRSKASPKLAIYESLMFARKSEPYDESKCRYVWSDAVVFSEFPTLQWCSHYWMEFLSSIFFVVASRESESRPSEHPGLRKKPVFIIRRKFYDRSSPNFKRDFSNLPPYHAGIWPMLSDHEWMEWDDILGVLANGVGGPSQLCFRRLHVLQDYNMTTPPARRWRRTGGCTARACGPTCVFTFSRAYRPKFGACSSYDDRALAGY